MEAFHVRSFEGPAEVTTVSEGDQWQDSERATNSVKVDLDASNVRSPDRNHAEEPVFPPPEESNSLV